MEGMTIDESINQIIDSLMGKKANLLNHSDRVALTDALNTMRKYQKIEQLIADYEEYKWERGVVCKREITVKDIKEVIEDGKNT